MKRYIASILLAFTACQDPPKQCRDDADCPDGQACTEYGDELICLERCIGGDPAACDGHPDRCTISKGPSVGLKCSPAQRSGPEPGLCAALAQVCPLGEPACTEMHTACNEDAPCKACTLAADVAELACELTAVCESFHAFSTCMCSE